VYRTVYRSKGGTEVITTTPYKPARHRLFKQAGGVRKFTAVSCKSHYERVIIVAKSKKKSKSPKSPEVEDTELDELEELEDLDDLDDEDDDEDEDEPEDEDDDEDEDEDDEEDDDDEDDEDEDDEPAPKKSKKSKKAPAKSKKKKSSDDGVGTADLAEAAGTDARTLRIYLRKNEVPKNEDRGRYWWPSLNDKAAKKIIKDVKGGAAEAAKKESLERLKDSQKDKKSKKKGKKKSKK